MSPANRGESGSIRAEVLRRLKRIIGPEAIPQWLASRQPAFDDDIVGRVLTRDPQRVLRHVILLDIEDYDNEPADPLTERFATPRKESHAAKIIKILDELEGGSE